MSEPRLLRAQEFASRAGVTVRTLHHYDRIGLLRPAGRTASGQRLYGDQELLKLERIAALKFIGLGLAEIKRVVEGESADLLATLRQQQAAIMALRRQLDDVLDAIVRAQVALTGDAAQTWDRLREIIRLMEAKNDMEWFKKYYTEEQLADLATRGTPEVLAKAQQDWQELLAEVEASLDEDPASAHAQSLVQRRDSLIAQFTGGDEGIHQNLQRLYADRANWPANFKQPFSDEAAAFLARARAARSST